MRIFYINFDFPPISGPGIWRAMAFVKYWREAGHDISVFCSDRSIWCGRIDESNLDKIPNDVFVFRKKSLLANDVKVFFEKKKNQTRNPLLAKLYGGLSWRMPRVFPTHAFFWVLAVVTKGLWHARRGRPDIIFSSGPPHDSHIANLIISKILRVKMVIDYRDLWFDEDMDDDINYPNMIEHFLEKLCLKKSNLVVSVSPTWKNHLENKYQINHKNLKFIVVYNGHDISEQIFNHTFKSQHENKTHIHYNGTPQLTQFGIEFFKAVNIIKDSSVKSYLPIIITFTGMGAEFLRHIENFEISSFFEDVGFMPYSDAVALSLTSDSLMIAIDHCYKSTLGTIPGKAYEAMALGKHVFAVLPPGSDLEPILHEYGNCTICSSRSADDIADGLLSLREKLDKPQQKPPEGFLDKYSRKNQAGLLLNKFEQLIG